MAERIRGATGDGPGPKSSLGSKGSPAAVRDGGSSLITKGDVITAIGGKPTPDLEAFGKAVEKLRKDKPPVVLVAYTRGRVSGFAALNLALGESK